MAGFLDKVKGFLQKEHSTVEQAIDKAGEFVDHKTDGKFHDAVHTVQDVAKNAATKAPDGE